MAPDMSKLWTYVYLLVACVVNRTPETRLLVTEPKRLAICVEECKHGES